MQENNHLPYIDAFTSISEDEPSPVGAKDLKQAASAPCQSA